MYKNKRFLYRHLVRLLMFIVGFRVCIRVNHRWLTDYVGKKTVTRIIADEVWYFNYEHKKKKRV